MKKIPIIEGLVYFIMTGEVPGNIELRDLLVSLE